MFLASIAVENYRALRSARLGFDGTTVLVGENDCGKTSLIEALVLVLDPEGEGAAPRFQSFHFHRGAAGVGPIRIALTFRERHGGEWDALADTALAPALGRPGTTLRAMTLEVFARPSGADHEVVGQWRLHAEGDERAATSAADALAQLRRRNPLIRLRGGMLGAPSLPVHVRRQAPAVDARVAPLVERIERAYTAIVGGTAKDVPAMLDEGFAAARELIAVSRHHLDDARHGSFREMVAEILGERALPGSSPAAMPLPGEATGERIGLLLLTAALLRAIPDALAPGAEPVWVIEDPEAQLHPMTLAAVMALIGRIRWQKILTTQSGDVLAGEPLGALRRLTRRGGVLREWRVRPRSLSLDDLRRVDYHLRSRRGVAMFARCWLLVEGETEFWLMPELARLAGHDFALEGVVCVEFAQCGLAPLIKLARELGIEWHVLTDGDQAGKVYAERVRSFVRRGPEERRLTLLRERDIENCFYQHGYAGVFQRLAGVHGEELPGKRVVERAIHRLSKPMLALEMVLAAASRGSKGVPPPLARTIATCVALAREAPTALSA
jgi:putative ATP-dependent endonuclease of OLD family